MEEEEDCDRLGSPSPSRRRPLSDVRAHDAPAAAVPPPPSSTAAQESRTRIENIAPENDTRWRGVAPLPPPPLASHSWGCLQQEAHGARMSALLRREVERRH